MAFEEINMNSHTTATEAITLARQLHSLRRDGKQVPTEQLVSVPTSPESAMDVQRALSKLEGADIPAWKVAKSPGGAPVAAPLYPYWDNPDGAALTWRSGLKIEVEIAVKLSNDLPVQADALYGRADIEAAISDAYLGTELVWSGISEGGSVSFLAFLADRLGNMGYVKGPALPLAVLRPGSNFPLRIQLDAQVMFDADAQHPAGDPLTWLCDYANDRTRPAASLNAGSIVTTGSLCGALDVAAPGNIGIKLGALAVMNIALSSTGRL
ncbi:2-keto-4-pentenoate hydratase [Agrobacterium rhizogenes]|uniref:2-keto-4-pentenoate hydratase n=1 Tax=Rhizobium rhizogenes TaxID=359 RepID=UPI0022B675F5|nr:2-keto-4-pentenoate hydratase [Rhizobium rhizogenes]MCZ7449267.1 2-keto-4-pentenoate hydratase [Rhizobium rhizogenes]